MSLVTKNRHNEWLWIWIHLRGRSSEERIPPVTVLALPLNILISSELIIAAQSHPVCPDEKKYRHKTETSIETRKPKLEIGWLYLG